MNFDQYYNKLNAAQKKAVDTVEGPVMVIAGPGTGKTQILTLRIANILIKTQVNPENILALTFTESAVLNMRRRLVDMIGTPGYKVKLSTFHGFCNDIIKQNPEDFPYLISSESMTEVEQIQIIEKIILDNKFELLKPFGDPLYHLRTILSAINDLKKEGVTTEAFKKSVEQWKLDFDHIPDLVHEKGAYKGQMKGKYQDMQKDIQKNEELVQIYQQYQDALREKKLYDFNDMLLEVISTLQSNSQLLLRLQEQYQYILVDEHQDTNAAQNKLVELLGNFYDVPNLFVVGDEKQAIFRFQGASLENFMYFQTLYPTAQLVHLEDNYRSTQTILDAAGSMIRQNATAEILSNSSKLKARAAFLGKNQENPSSLRGGTTKQSPPNNEIASHGEQARNKETLSLRDDEAYRFMEEKIKIAALSSYYGEYHFATQEIKKLIDQGIDPREIAILCRNNRDLLPIAHVLEQYGVAYTIEADQNILSDPQVRKLLTIFRAINGFGKPSADADLMLLLHCDFLQIDPLDVYKLMHHSRKHKLQFFEVISKPILVTSLRLATGQKINDLFEQVKNWHILSQNDTLEKLFNDVLHNSGFLKWIMAQPNALDMLDKISNVFEEIKVHTQRNPLYSLDDFLTYLDLLNNHDILIKKPVKSALKRSIRLMTAHKSKGLEFEYVFILGAYDGHWGNLRKRSRGINLPWEQIGIKLKLDVDLESNEDERRLFYVALTRARRQILISYASAALDGKEQVPSQFLSEIADDFKEDLDCSEFEKQFGDHPESLFMPNTPSGIMLSDPNFADTKEFFKELFLERGLSVTALNNYLNCPWRYFYNNLLYIPEAKDIPPLLFGNAVHNALSRYLKALGSHNPDKQFLMDAFAVSLKKTLPVTQDFDLYMQKGQRALDGFYDHEMVNWHPKMISEMFVYGVKLDNWLALNGKLDLIEPLNASGEVAVYDFKTGKPKTRGEIEGTTQFSDGGYKRQLVFYKLLLDNYQLGRMKMRQSGLIFVEPDTTGKYRKEVFDISDEEVSALEYQVRFVAEEIQNLEFWDRRCEDPACQFCQLRDIMVSAKSSKPVILDIPEQNIIVPESLPTQVVVPQALVEPMVQALVDSPPQPAPKKRKPKNITPDTVPLFEIVSESAVTHEISKHAAKLISVDEQLLMQSPVEAKK